MDTSAEYIKMCNCPEIQDEATKATTFYRRRHVLYNPSTFVYVANYSGHFWHCAENNLQKIEDMKYNNAFIWEIWLPRQDQLQEMLNWKHQPRAMLRNMANFVNDGHCLSLCEEKHGEFKAYGKRISTLHMKNWSPEQLWLAFVMYEKYKKQWNGKEWVSENPSEG